MSRQKLAYTATIELTVRILVDDDIDPEFDPEFNEAVVKRVRKRLIEEKDAFLTENITGWDLDEEQPFDPEVE